MTTLSHAFDQELAANLNDLRTKRPREQEFYASPTLLLMRKKAVKTQGHYIEVDVQFVGDAEGGVIGDNTVSSTAHVKSLDRAQYEPTLYAEPASMTKKKEENCGGSRALFNEWDRRVSLADKRQEKQLATHLWAASLAATQNADGEQGITPIPVMFPGDNTTGTIGNLSRASYDWWRHYSSTSAGAFTSVGHDEMDAMEQGIWESSGMTPDFYACSSNIFRRFKKAARGTTNFDPTYTGKYADKLNDAGIKAVSWNGVPVVSDKYMSDGYIYAINCDATYLGVHTSKHIGGPYPQQGQGSHGKVLYHYYGIQLIGEEMRANGQISGLT